MRCANWFFLMGFLFGTSIGIAEELNLHKDPQFLEMIAEYNSSKSIIELLNSKKYPFHSEEIEFLATYAKKQNLTSLPKAVAIPNGFQIVSKKVKVGVEYLLDEPDFMLINGRKHRVPSSIRQLKTFFDLVPAQLQREFGPKVSLVDWVLPKANAVWPIFVGIGFAIYRVYQAGRVIHRITKVSKAAASTGHKVRTWTKVKGGIGGVSALTEVPIYVGGGYVGWEALKRWDKNHFDRLLGLHNLLTDKLKQCQNKVDKYPGQLDPNLRFSNRETEAGLPSLEMSVSPEPSFEGLKQQLTVWNARLLHDLTDTELHCRQAGKWKVIASDNLNDLETNPKTVANRRILKDAEWNMRGAMCKKLEEFRACYEELDKISVTNGFANNSDRNKKLLVERVTRILKESDFDLKTGHPKGDR